MKRIFCIFLLAVAVISAGIWLHGSAQAAACTAITYTAPSGSGNNITYTFDKSYTCGQFANGDWFVIPDSPGGTVVITGISPSMTTGRNGVDVNPLPTTYTTPQRWDNRLSQYSAPSVSFPYAAHQNESVIKVVSMGTCASTTCIQFGAVLTVLNTAPSSPSTTFRPPYAGTTKTLLSTNDLHPEYLKRLASSCCTDKMSNTDAATQGKYVRLNYSPDSVSGYYMIPADSVVDGRAWGADMMVNDVGTLGWLNMDNDCSSAPCTSEQDLAAKMPVLTNMVQQGIDIWGYDAQGGAGYFRGGGGNGSGALTLMTFAAAMLDNTSMKSHLATLDPDHFWETASFYRGTVSAALWGQEVGTEHDYWDELLASDPSSRTIRDPYGYIDGGAIPGGWYQALTSDSVSYLALLMHIMPAYYDAWTTVGDNANVMMDYGDRWHTHGALTSPDPCHVKTGTYGTNYGPNGSGGCVSGSGRALAYDGYKDDGAPRKSAMMEEMYTAYRTSGGVAGDLDDDGDVDQDDLDALKADYGQTVAGGGAAVADLNNDGKINVLDLSTLLDNWTE